MALSRRPFLTGGLALLAFQVVPAAALSTSKAEQTVQSVVREVQSAINGGGSQSSMLRKFEDIFKRYADVQTVARSVLGPSWRTTSSGDRSAYVGAFRGYVTRKYGKRFQEFRGAKIDVQRAKDFGKKGVVVSSTVKLSGQSPVAVDWRLSAKSGKLVDIIIEGVSLISTERSEVQSMLAAQRGSVAKLTSVLKSAG